MLFRSFDLVIASEVLEHVEQPVEFLHVLRSRVAHGGALVLTVPNGHGPAEVAAMLEALLQVSGIYRLLRALWRGLGLKPVAHGGAATPLVDSLALSPHVNFFSHREMLRLLATAGFVVTQFQPRTFLCGFGFDHVVGLFGLAAWNARVADCLPASLVSDWMFLALPAGEPGPATYRRGAYARFRHRLNRRRTSAVAST